MSHEIASVGGLEGLAERDFEFRALTFAGFIKPQTSFPWFFRDSICGIPQEFVRSFLVYLKSGETDCAVELPEASAIANQASSRKIETISWARKKAVRLFRNVFRVMRAIPPADIPSRAVGPIYGRAATLAL